MFLPNDGILGLPILGFRVYKYDILDDTPTQSDDDDVAELVFEGPHNSIGARISKLIPERRYQFAVECFNGIGVYVLTFIFIVVNQTQTIIDIHTVWVRPFDDVVVVVDDDFQVTAKREVGSGAMSEERGFHVSADESNDATTWMEAGRCVAGGGC